MIKEYLKEILLICCEEFDISIEEIKSKSRKQEIVFCRKAFCRIVKITFDIKNEIPAKILNKKHQDISRYLSNEPDNKYYKMIFDRIKMRLKNEKTFIISSV